MTQIITGFHAIEERIRHAQVEEKVKGLSIKLAKNGPRIKKILEAAQKAGIPVTQTSKTSLDELVKILPETARDHRGIVMVAEVSSEKKQNGIDFDQWLLKAQKEDSEKKQTVIVLDSVTDPHNVGAILRSCDQFGASLVVLPARRGVNNFSDNEIIARSSAGASEYMPVSIVTNLVRAVQQLKKAGFWVYGADAGGNRVTELDFPARTCIVMGSEGKGISRLLQEECDGIVSIPTCGNIDSLNVSVATGVLLYEIYRQELCRS